MPYRPVLDFDFSEVDGEETLAGTTRGLKADGPYDSSIRATMGLTHSCPLPTAFPKVTTSPSDKRVDVSAFSILGNLSFCLRK